MATKKKVSEEQSEESKPQELPNAKLVFICNVNHDNKEYKAGQEWSGQVPECLKQFLK
jgi:hypothetical protein